MAEISDLRHLDQRKKLLMIEYLREKLDKEREQRKIDKIARKEAKKVKKAERKLKKKLRKRS